MKNRTPFVMQLIDGKGEFKVKGPENFMQKMNLTDHGLSAVVSIIGPQSSGKSTLLNCLFDTNFKVMDASKRRARTTKGIWIANCVGRERPTICIDIEGTDGKERGEDDTNFEKQSALLALAISDVMMINMWYTDLGRENAANRPLLRTIFKAVTRLISPRKSTLLFVVRDSSNETPREKLEHMIRKDVEKIWKEIEDARPHTDLFKVEIICLSHLLYEPEKFRMKVAKLRERFNSNSPEGHAYDRSKAISASRFYLTIQNIWNDIKANKNLNLPAIKVMVATTLCEEIANKKLGRLTSNEDWLALKRAAKEGRRVSGFEKKLTSILNKYYSEYNIETRDMERRVRAAKQKQLKSKALELVRPACEKMLELLRLEALKSFKTELEEALNRESMFAESVRTCTKSCMRGFDQECTDATISQANWDFVSNFQKKLDDDIEEHALSLRSAKLTQLKASYQKRITKKLEEPVKDLLRKAGREDTWASIRNRLNGLTVVSKFSNAISEFNLDETTSDPMVQELGNYGRSLVVKLTREASADVLIWMKNRFYASLNDSANTSSHTVRIKDALDEALEVLSNLAAVRLTKRPDKIRHLLFSTLRPDNASTDKVRRNTWQEVSKEDTLILRPLQCLKLWEQFLRETRNAIKGVAPQNDSTGADKWIKLGVAVASVALVGVLPFVMPEPVTICAAIGTALGQVNEALAAFTRKK